MKIDMETTPLIQQRIVEFMRSLATDAIERDVWDDEQPQVWLVAKHTHALGFPEIAVAQMPIPDIIWSQDRPPVVIAVLAQSCKIGPHPLTPEARADLYGVVMLSETWDLNIPEGATRQEMDEARDFVQKRGIPDHPWGVEAKTVFARDIDGWHIVVSRRRGSESAPEHISVPGQNATSGALPDALHALLEALR